MKADTKQAEKKLKNLAADAIIANERAALKSGLIVQAKAQVYPPQSSGSTYRRTGTLGRKWDTEVRPMGGMITAIVDNPTEYADWVKGKTKQTRVHKANGWPSILDDAKASLPEIIEVYQGEYDDLAKKYNK